VFVSWEKVSGKMTLETQQKIEAEALEMKPPTLSSSKVEAQALEMKLPILGLRFSLGFVGRATLVQVVCVPPPLVAAARAC
jgi:hypothetical protein